MNLCRSRHAPGCPLCRRLASASAFATFCAAQQTPAHPAKVLTPAQKAYQQQWREWLTSHQKLQAQGRQIFSEEMSRDKAGDCPLAQSTIAFESCYAKQIDITDANLKSYEDIIRQLLAPAPEMPGTRTNTPGPAGQSFTPAQQMDEFNRVEQLWVDYRKGACTAAFHQFDGGTGGPPFQQKCTLKLARDHMRELDTIYGNLLHL